VSAENAIALPRLMVSRSVGHVPGAARGLSFLAAAAGLLALALGVSNGHLHPVAFVLMLAALVATVLGVRAAADSSARPDAEGVKVLGAGLALSLLVHVLRPPGIYLENADGLARLPFLIGLGAATVLVGGAIVAPERWARARLPALVAIHFLLGMWVIRHSPRPHMDVFVVHKEAIAALFAGRNPYAITFTDIYGANSPFYVPGMVVGGQVQSGYPYPPLCLLFAAVGQLVGGDPRCGELVAMAITGALIAGAGRSRVGFLAAALFLFAPRTFFMLEQAWTDTYLAMFMALLVFCGVRWRRALPVALGLFLGTKQYAVLTIPLFPFLLPDRRSWGSTAVKAALVAAAVVLPGVLWNAHAYWQSVYGAQFRQPFRPDSLNVSAAIAYLTHWHPPNLVGFAAAGAAWLLAWRWCPRTPAGFAAAVALFYFSFFAFGRQAFCNYYFFIGAALCLAISAWKVGEPGAAGA
jgi:4-amino-4-deoxy-L-arabinose transferase-like glycosyltransferase